MSVEMIRGEEEMAHTLNACACGRERSSQPMRLSKTRERRWTKGGFLCSAPCGTRRQMSAGSGASR